jgi:uncharacterized protein
MRVEVAYAAPDRQLIKSLEISEAATIKEAILASKIIDDFPEIDLDTAKVGIFSRLASLTTLLKSGDRVEIYRPLTIDPKAARRRRAK